MSVGSKFKQLAFKPAGCATYRIASNYSNALRTSQTCSFSKWYHILHPKVAFEAPWSCARCGIKFVYDVTLHPSVKWCWKTLLFEYLAAIRYALLRHTISRPPRCMSRSELSILSHVHFVSNDFVLKIITFLFLRCFYQFCFLIIKIINFRGDLPDVYPLKLQNCSKDIWFPRYRGVCLKLSCLYPQNGWIHFENKIYDQLACLYPEVVYSITEQNMFAESAVLLFSKLHKTFFGYRYVSLYQTPLCRNTRYTGQFTGEGTLLLHCCHFVLNCSPFNRNSRYTGHFFVLPTSPG